MPAIPSYARPTGKKMKYQRPKKAKLTDFVSFDSKPSPKPGKKAAYPSSEMPETESKGYSTAGTLARAAQAMPGRGKYGRALKGALAGAAAGAEIESSYKKYKEKRAKKKAKEAKTTVSQSAMTQKANFHKKDQSRLEKV